MSAILKKESADKVAFKHNPKAIHMATSHAAKDFVSMQATKGGDFQIAEIVANQTGVTELRRKNIDAQVEDTVLERLKEIEEKAYKQAYDLGLLEGTEKAFEEMRVVYQEKLQMLDDLLVAVEYSKTNVMKENEAVLIHLVYQVAQRIAQREIKISQEPIVKMLNELVGEIQGTDSINVTLNSDDFHFIEELRNKKVKEVEPLARVKLISDETISSGGCVIETNFGSIVSTVEQRAEKAWKLLEEKIPLVKRETD